MTDPMTEGAKTGTDDVEWPCVKCGLPQSKNPHPDAGDPTKLCEVGAMYECLPCSFGRSMRAADHASKAKRELTEALKVAGEAQYFVQQLLADLPAKRDWLNPDIERALKDFTNSAALERIRNQS